MCNESVVNNLQRIVNLTWRNDVPVYSKQQFLVSLEREVTSPVMMLFSERLGKRREDWNGTQEDWTEWMRGCLKLHVHSRVNFSLDFRRGLMKNKSRMRPTRDQEVVFRKAFSEWLTPVPAENNNSLETVMSCRMAIEVIDGDQHLHKSQSLSRLSLLSFGSIWSVF